MVGKYTQLFIHLILVVKRRKKHISYSWETELYKYITGFFKNKKQKLLAVNGMPDHLHLLIGLSSDCSISELVRELKKSTNHFINNRFMSSETFYWQNGYAAFSFGKRDLTRLFKYVATQKQHHLKEKFIEEYISALNKEGVEYEEKYLP